MSTISEDTSVSSQRSCKDTLDLFESAAWESTVYQAYQAFNSCPIHQSLNIPDEIWKAMEHTIQECAKEIREQVKANDRVTNPTAQVVSACTIS